MEPDVDIDAVDRLDHVTVAPASKRRLSIPLISVVLLLVGSVFQGIGVNIDHYRGDASTWSGLAVFVFVGLSAWFARRLNRLLILFVPLAIILMAVPATMAEYATKRPVYKILYETGPCKGGEQFTSDLESISAQMAAWTNDVNTTTSPTLQDINRWANSARTLRHKWENVRHPKAFNRYIELSVQIFQNYEDGFTKFANGDREGGMALVDQGDQARAAAHAEFLAAQSTCST